jgi:hypothetical protein
MRKFLIVGCILIFVVMGCTPAAPTAAPTDQTWS